MKNSSASKFDFVYFEEQKVTLGVYDVNKNISDGVVVLINRVRTPREELLGRKNWILCILRYKN